MGTKNEFSRTLWSKLFTIFTCFVAKCVKWFSISAGNEFYGLCPKGPQKAVYMKKVIRLPK